MPSTAMKQRIVRALRSAGMLTAAERMRYVRSRLLCARSNRYFAAQHSEPMPPPWITYDALSSVDYSFHWNAGLVWAAYLEKLAHEYLPLPTTVCEWGCGPARIVRHLTSRAPEVFSEISGTDYNEASIAWCRRHIPGVTFYLNGLAPPLPLGDASVDFIYSFSVFTHLSEPMCHAWLKEQLRVVRPGGMILFTTQGDRYRDKLLPDERALYDRGEFVLRGSVTEGSRLYSAFHSPDYVKGRLVAGLEVLLHDPGSDVATGQDVWLIRGPQQRGVMGPTQRAQQATWHHDDRSGSAAPRLRNAGIQLGAAPTTVLPARSATCTKSSISWQYCS